MGCDYYNHYKACLAFEHVGWKGTRPVETADLASGGGDAVACWELSGLNSEPSIHSLD